MVLTTSNHDVGEFNVPFFFAPGLSANIPPLLSNSISSFVASILSELSTVSEPCILVDSLSLLP